MARKGQQEAELPYRTPVSSFAPPTTVTPDADHFGTLERVQKEFHLSMDGLYKDFNAFDVVSEGEDKMKAETMMRQIAGKQYAYDVLAPLLGMLDDAVKKINATGGQG